MSEKNDMRKINQRSLQQAGVIITRKGGIVPFFRGENPIDIAKSILTEHEDGIRYIFGCLDPLEFQEFIKSYKSPLEVPEVYMNELRSGFSDVNRYGFNTYICKNNYA